MPLIYSRQLQQQENEDSVNTRRRILPRIPSRYNLDYQDDSSLVRQSDDYTVDTTETSSSGNHSLDDSNSNHDSSSSESSSSLTDDSEVEVVVEGYDNSQEDDDDDDDNTTITESFTRSRVDIYRLAIRTNNEILEDLTAIIRILRQINAIYRVFNNRVFNNNSTRSTTTTIIRSRRNRILTITRPVGGSSGGSSGSGSGNSGSLEQDTIEEDTEEDSDDEEANKLLEAGLQDLQTVLTMENNGGIKRQSTLALLALITYQYNHCSENYLQHYLDPNGDYNPTLAIFAAATYDEEEQCNNNQPPKSCKDIIMAAEEICGPDWLNEFHKGKDGPLRKMLQKLTFVAQIRLKVRDVSTQSVIR